MGPTGVGKTALAVALAERFRGEVISADSRQVYRQMDIGTGKPSAEEQRLAPHHLLDLLDPSESFDLATFLALAHAAIDEVKRAGRFAPRDRRNRAIHLGALRGLAGATGGA